MSKCYHEQDKCWMCCAESSQGTQILKSGHQYQQHQTSEKTEQVLWNTYLKGIHFTACKTSVSELHRQECKAMHASTFQNSGSVPQRHYGFGSNLWYITGFQGL